MPRYDFYCDKCNIEWEATRPIIDRRSKCKCGREGKMIFKSAPLTTRDKLFHFTDLDTFDKPIEIRGKDHWYKELKKRGLTDDTISKRPDRRDERKRERIKAIHEAIKDDRSKRAIHL